ncbi:sulfate ABC transporter permease [Vibrio alginolyticus]|uniref:sulfate ABC transporter permease n=1 Tax=Vibrio alginolyticus TaxID=663 RepID=UPI001C9BF41C|nr:sulfate ABC transporter permease [Vibrio alginolyticus]MBY7695579.1 sulfate ABC transporter permease [Vibrio alginolyticus]
MKKYLTMLSLSIATFPSSATIELTEQLSLSGFGSTSWAKSDNPTTVLVNRFIGDESCFDCDTTFGMQLDYFHKAFRASAQVVKRPQDHWSSPQLEWAYLAYTYKDIEIRGGRLRLPLFLMSEYNYVGHAFTQARPPNEVYDSILGITAYSGLSARWIHDLNEQVVLTAMPFVGFKDNSDVTINERTELEIESNNTAGMNLTLSGESYRWNFSYLHGDYDQTTTLSNIEQSTPGGGTTIIDRLVETEKNNTIDLFSLGLRYELDNIVIMAEGQTSNLSSSWYATTSYNVNKLTPYIVYGQQFNNRDKKSGDSFLLGLRYDLDYNVSLNAEWQRFNAYNNSSGAFSSAPKDDSASLYTLMLNFVF